MNWRVFNRDDPDTWPEINCKFLVFGDNDELVICKWDKILKCFYDGHGFAEYWECFYVNIGYLPFIEKEVHPIKCTVKDVICEYDDNGYCLCENACSHQEKATEYCLGYKRVWKEI